MFGNTVSFLVIFCVRNEVSLYPLLSGLTRNKFGRSYYISKCTLKSLEIQLHCCISFVYIMSYHYSLCFYRRQVQKISSNLSGMLDYLNIKGRQ